MNTFKQSTPWNSKKHTAKPQRKQRLGAKASLMVLAFLPLLAWAPQGHANETCRSLNISHVVDGDTIRLQSGEYIRLAGIDTPEIDGQCPAEIQRALDAKGNLALQLAPGRDLQYCPLGRDYYGRILATVHADGQDIGHLLKVSGYARQWTGKRETWCNG